MIFFAGASANQNDLVENEAKSLGCKIIDSYLSGVEFEADLRTAYKFALNTRCATKLLMLICKKDNISDFDTLFNESLNIQWENYLDLNQTFMISQTTSKAKWIKNTHFIELKFKDAVVERFRSVYNDRPNVDRDNPDVCFHIHINENEVFWYLDFAGRGLSKRGYRKEETKAVMSEFLASSVIYRSMWYKDYCKDNLKNMIFLDPFCGSGTLCIEAALMCTNTAPGLIDTDRFGFINFPFHDEQIWEEVISEAREKVKKTNVKIYGFDVSEKAISISRENTERAGLSDVIKYKQVDFSLITEMSLKELLGFSTDLGSNLNSDLNSNLESGAENDINLNKINTDYDNEISKYLVTDLPYGHRLETNKFFYSMVGSILSSSFKGWNVSLLCSNSELLSNIDMKPNRVNTLTNGGIECQLAHYYVFTDKQREEMTERAKQRREERLSQTLSSNAQMVANRLMKNKGVIQKEMEERGISCFRLYDADMPEYSVAIDVYENKWVNLQEYAPPKTINPEDAERRLSEAVLATERVTGINIENIYIKRREIQKGSNQYSKLNSFNKFNLVHEGGHVFSVNFTDNLDTGIFLDHRLLRKKLQEVSEKKRFLNLFCYTGTATVYAASGGALSTVSVDSSNYYLNWAKQNMSLNGYTSMNHFYYKSDVFEYLRTNRDTFDLIYCDPPTFSNSKSRGTFDIQKDHAKLIRLCVERLSKNGVLYFSTNFTKFKMFEELYDEFEIKDITKETIDTDFLRHRNIHKCFIIQKKVHSFKRVKFKLKRLNSLS